MQTDNNEPFSTAGNLQRLYSWKAPLRAYRRRSKIVLRFYIALSLLLSFLVLFFGDKILILVILTLMFLFYVLTITPPPQVENILTTFGIESPGITFHWENISHFYYMKKLGFDVLVLVGKAPLYYHAYFVIPNNEVKKHTFEILSRHIMFVEKPQRSFTDKMIDLLSRLIPEDEEEPQELPVSHVQKKLRTFL